MTTPGDHEAMYEQLIRDYLHHLSLECSPGTVDLYASVLTRAHQELPQGLVVACHSELEKWLWRPQWSPKTRETYLAPIRGLYQWLLVRGIVDYDPTGTLPRIRVPERLLRRSR